MGHIVKAFNKYLENSDYICNKKEDKKLQTLFIKPSVLKICEFGAHKGCNAAKLFIQALRTFLSGTGVAKLLQSLVTCTELQGLGV